jgi:hypothetical protein
MESENSIATSVINVLTVKEKNISGACKVCGEENAHTAFGTLSCSSCKVFFRRNAQFDLVRQLLTIISKDSLFFYIEYSTMYIW